MCQSPGKIPNPLHIGFLYCASAHIPTILYPMGANTPFRIDLFDQEIESIRAFEPLTQRSFAATEQISLLPAREFATDEQSRKLFQTNYFKAFEPDFSSGQAAFNYAFW